MRLCFEKTFLTFTDETKESERLSEDEFEEKYASQVLMMEEIGKQGGAISKFTNLSVTEWYQLLEEGKKDQIVAAFDGDEFPILFEIVDHLDGIYKTGRE